MLTTFLIGLAAGSAVATRFLGRIRNPLAVFAFVELVVGLAVYLGTFVFPELPYAFLALFRATRSQPALFQIGRFVLAALVMFAPTFMLGATFPLGVRCWRMGGVGAARPVGTLYAVNTLGAIVGSLAAGFFLVPVVGLRLTIVAGAVVNLTVGAFLLSVAPSESRRRSLFLAGLVVVMLPAIPGGASEWNPVVMTSGVFQYAPRYAPQFPTRASFFAYHDAHRQLFYRDGPTTTVTVEKRPLTKGGHVWLVLTVNGKVDASSIGDIETQVLLGQFPLLAARDPRRALVIGWGSGATAGSMLTLPSLQTLRAVEIEPAVIEASHFFREFNHDPYGDPRLSLEINDARHALLVDDTTYDVIVSEPSNPWLSGPSRLFTREFFEIVRSRLAPDGILCQWVQLYGLDPDAYRALLRTLGSVFEDVVVVKGSPGDTLVMASPKRIRFDVARMAERMAIPSVAADLSRLQIADPETLLTRFRVGGRAMTAFAGVGPLNTDDNALIEFAALKNLYDETHFQNDELLLKAPSSPLDRVDVAGLSPEAAARFPIDFAAALSRAGLDDRALDALVRANSPRISEAALAEGSAIRGDIDLRAGKRAEAREAWKKALARNPGCVEAAASLGLDLADGDTGAGEAAWLLAATVAAEPDSADARVALARALRATGRHADAIDELKAAERIGPSPATAPFVHMLWGRSCLALSDPACAAREIGRYFDEWPELTKPARMSVDAALDLGRAELTLGRKQAALEHLKLAVDTAAAVASWERDQADAASRRGDGDAVESHLRAVLEWSPADAAGYRRLGDFLMGGKRWEDALGVWSQLLKRHPDDLTGLTRSVETLEHLDRADAAAPLLGRLIDLEEDPDRVRMFQAMLDRAKGGTGTAP
ncbi:MAG: fused MFS/spermidine synthase [Acidobacteria bacterium]|nr:fused MFS/spermidine synthase [Acidobacteriota bacterium]